MNYALIIDLLPFNLIKSIIPTIIEFKDAGVLIFPENQKKRGLLFP